MPRIPLPLLRTLAVLGALLLIGQASFSRASAPRTVTVQPGDTLWGLSLRYHVDMNRLASVNEMDLSDILVIGRVVEIPGRSRGDAAAAGTSHQASPGRGDPTQMQSFCADFRPPTEPVGALPSQLVSQPDRLALRPLFVRWASAYGVSPSLIEAIAWQESGWQNDVVSSADAHGIGQLLPQTAAFVSESLIGRPLNMSVPSDNIRMSARYLAFLLRATGGRVCEAVASYYQGLGTTQHLGLLPETQGYVRSVLGLRPRFR